MLFGNAIQKYFNNCYKKYFNKTICNFTSIMVNKIFPYTYRAFGLIIRSQFPVFGFLPVANEETADVLIERGTVPRSLEVITNNSVLCQANENEFLMHLDGIGGFFVQQGKKIIVEKHKTANWKDINVFIIGRLFGALLQQKQILTLHGGAIRYKGINFIFIGHSGSGKSTLTAMLCDKGAEFLSDDLVAIKIIDDTPVIIPSFPLIKLWDDSLASLGKTNFDFIKVRNEYKKYYIPMPRFLESHCKPDQIISLHTHNQDDFKVINLYGMDKFLTLKNHAYFMQGNYPKKGEELHFSAYNQLARQTKITRLTRPIGPIKINQMIKEIESIAGIL
jgi:hypothetical protein